MKLNILINAYNLLDRVVAHLLIAIVLLYRKVVSPLFGSHCRFVPTCSEYALTAVKTKPVHKAVYVILRRIGRCHPYRAGGYDPVR